MGNMIRFNMTNTPPDVKSIYVVVKKQDPSFVTGETVFQGALGITSNAVKIDIGGRLSIGDGVMIFADNFKGNTSSFKAIVGNGIVEQEVGGFLDTTSSIYEGSVLSSNSEIWSI